MFFYLKQSDNAIRSVRTRNSFIHTLKLEPRVILQRVDVKMTANSSSIVANNLLNVIDSTLSEEKTPIEVEEKSTSKSPIAVSNRPPSNSANNQSPACTSASQSPRIKLVDINKIAKPNIIADTSKQSITIPISKPLSAPSTNHEILNSQAQIPNKDVGVFYKIIHYDYNDLK